MSHEYEIRRRRELTHGKKWCQEQDAITALLGAMDDEDLAQLKAEVVANAKLMEHKEPGAAALLATLDPRKSGGLRRMMWERMTGGAIAAPAPVSRVPAMSGASDFDEEAA